MRKLVWVTVLCVAGAGWGDKSAPVCSIVYDGGAAKIRVDGKDYEPRIYVSHSSVETEPLLAINAKTHALGFPFHEIKIRSSLYERASGVYDFAKVDHAVRTLLARVPDAYLILGLNLTLHKWSAAHPEECVGYADGPAQGLTVDEYTGRPLRASAASRPYRTEAMRCLDAFAAFVDAQPWSARVVGFRLAWGVYGEWHLYGMHHAPDGSAAMTATFHRFDGGRYADEEAPTLAERSRGVYLLDSVADAKTVDYFRCLSDETTDFLLDGARRLKTHFPTRLVGAWYGYVFTRFPPEGANCRYDLVLASPHIDFCSNPAAYLRAAREAGGSYMTRAVPDAFRRHGKLFLLEDDMRFHHVRDYAAPIYCTADEAESAAVMRRNWLVAAFEGGGIQLTDPLAGAGKRPDTFDHPSVLCAIADTSAAWARAGSVPAASGNEVLLVVDPGARYRWSRADAGQRIISKVSEYLPQFVHTSGVAVDFATVQDYLAFDYPHRLVYFIDVCTLDADERAAIAAKASRPGIRAFRIAISGVPDFEPATAEKIPLPGSAADWARVFKSHGAHAFSEPGSLLRRHGDLILYSTGRAGHHTLTLRPTESAATELFTEQRFDGVRIELDTTTPSTWLFRVMR